MAGEWMPMRLDLADDPAVIGIALTTGLDIDSVIGKLFRLWSWANRHLANGHARSVTETWLDDYVRSNGFAKSLKEVGWLSVKNGELFIPKYDRWNTQSAKRRLLASRRKVTQRSRSERDKNATREEKSIEEKNTDKEQEQERPPTATVGAFDPQVRTPSPDDVKSYALSFGRGEEKFADEFWDHYASNGWLNKNNVAVRDWRAEFRKWVRARARNDGLPPGQTKQKKPDYMNFAS